VLVEVVVEVVVEVEAEAEAEVVRIFTFLLRAYLILKL
jgi:hypothetical protein